MTELGSVWLFDDPATQRLEVALLVAPLPADPEGRWVAKPISQVWVQEGFVVRLAVLSFGRVRFVEAVVSDALAPGTARPRSW